MYSNSIDHSSYLDQLAAGSSNQSHNLYHLKKSGCNSSPSSDSDSKLSYPESQFKLNSVNQPSEPDIKGNPLTGRSSYFTENHHCDMKEDNQEGFKSMISDSKKFKLDLSFNRIENLNDQQQCKSPKSLNSNQKLHQDLLGVGPPPVSPLPSPSIKNDKPINSKELKKIYSTWTFPTRTDSPRGLTWGPYKDESKNTRTRSQNQINRRVFVILKPLNQDQNQNQNQVQEEEIQREIKIELEESDDPKSIEKDLIETNSNKKIKPEIIITSTPNGNYHQPTLRSKKSKRNFEIEIQSEETKSINYKRMKSIHKQEVKLKQTLSFSLPHYLLFVDPIQMIKTNNQIIKTNRRILKNQELIDLEIKA